MRKPLLSRRTVLRGAGGATIALPFLEAMGWGQAEGPKRILLIATFSGTALTKWVPTHDGARDAMGRISAKITKMSDMFAPLEPFKEKIFQLRGAHGFSYEPYDDGHQPGKKCLWTNLRPSGGTGGPHAGPSIDEVIAAKLTGTTKFRKVDLGVSNNGGSGEFFGVGPGRTLRPETNPKTAAGLLFKNLTVDPNDPAVLLAKARRQSMLDTVKSNYGRLLAKRLGKEDQLRVQAHLDSVRELERSTNFVVSGAACSPPDLSADLGKSASGGPAYWATLDAHYDVIAKAFACDLTRVATLEIGHADNAGLTCKFGGTGIVNGKMHDDYSHGPTEGPQMMTIQNAYAEHLARFLGKLDAIQEGGRTALDNTIIAWSSEVNNGGSHSFDNSPFVLAGGAGGYFKPGRFIDFCTPAERDKNQMMGFYDAKTPGRFGGIGHGRVLVSLLNSMGVEAQTFGNPAFSGGPAPMLT